MRLHDGGWPLLFLLSVPVGTRNERTTCRQQHFPSGCLLNSLVCVSCPVLPCPALCLVLVVFRCDCSVLCSRLVYYLWVAMTLRLRISPLHAESAPVCISINFRSRLDPTRLDSTRSARLRLVQTFVRTTLFSRSHCALLCFVVWTRTSRFDSIFTVLSPSSPRFGNRCRVPLLFCTPHALRLYSCTICVR